MNQPPPEPPLKWTPECGLTQREWMDQTLAWGIYWAETPHAFVPCKSCANCGRCTNCFFKEPHPIHQEKT